MLARAVMPVVIVLNEKISSGTGDGDGGKMEVKGQSTLNVPQRRVSQNMRK